MAALCFGRLCMRTFLASDGPKVISSVLGKSLGTCRVPNVPFYWEDCRDFLKSCRQFSKGTTTLKFQINDIVEGKLQRIFSKYEALKDQLTGHYGSSGAKNGQLHKEFKFYQSVGDKYEEYCKVKRGIAELESLWSSADVPSTEEERLEMSQLVEEEKAVLQSQLSQLEQDLLYALLPSSHEEHRNAIVEVRPGTGGDEASLFASELLNMYTQYAIQKGWVYETLEHVVSDTGGVKFGSLVISGSGAFSRLRHEVGVHRVQRVPATETEGRIHTSTASVVVMCEADEVDIQIRDEDLRMEAYRASGAGGQHVNVTNSAVRLIHIPSGLVVTCQDERSQHRNKAKALRIIRAKLFEQERQRKAAATSAERRASIGSGDRHERIRTYNFSQDRITDHRVGLTLHGVLSVLSGGPASGSGQTLGLDDIIDALNLDEQGQQLLLLLEDSN
ncbi:hypothetical protein CEUSTIGMA_g5519.t1 [Chlamydomonas eustigma]|uniref:Prokaryotic-type class I peptide chain release factors domain-containing protein n=1 Tax=Chlamydomonas eustigma TaxID=1157962 RepID=A0A250X4R0_9CHLO|nr:hypothetical protein CEUSTIGMA_g5519.t1 [Chlamydomonas eustigma]|eukprot:GAX78077.1 hypothetical protein CEUSTIGMA_g5519.t1 [Chlamydomonas eustigma]